MINMEQDSYCAAGGMVIFCIYGKFLKQGEAK
jgi:hypothetical protein